MHTQLLNIGFIIQGDGSYYNQEVDLSITIDPDGEHVLVPTPKGTHKATIVELEDAIVGGGFGEF